MKKIFKIINLVILIFIFEKIDTTNDELFGDKSIIRKLRNELGSFESEIKFTDKNNTINIHKEQYTFKYKNGKLIEIDKHFLINLYLNDLTKYYLIDEIYCSSFNNHEIIEKILNLQLMIYSPNVTIKKIDFKLMGVSHFLFSLIDNYDLNKDDVKCENIEKEMRCDIVFENSAKIEYYFKDDNQLKMYPIKIKTFEKELDEYKLYLEIEYTKFDYSFNGDYYNVSSKLPIGKYCGEFCGKYCRLKSSNTRIATDFGDRFKLEYDFEFDYLDLANNNSEKFSKRKYSGNWFMDDEYEFNIIDGIDEETNHHLRTYYDSDGKFAFDVYEEDGKCIQYNVKKQLNYTLNWFYMQNISLFPEIFNIGNEKIFYSITFKYLGDYELNNTSYRIFENFVFLNQNLENKKGRKNLNNIEADKLIVTHYYNLDNNKIPKLIEIRLIDNRPKIVGIIKIKIKNYSLILEEDFNEKINIGSCFKDLNNVDYRELNIQFKSNLTNNSLNHNYIEYEFRKLIEKYSMKLQYSKDNKISMLSPLRINVTLKTIDNLINITAKLFDPLNSIQYFENFENFTLDQVMKIYNKIESIKYIKNQELCARSCIENRICASYSFQKLDNINTVCKLMIDYGFHRPYNWSKLNAVPNLNSILGRRLVKFNHREHQSTDYIINFIKKLINRKEFNLILKNNGDEIKFELIEFRIEPKKSRKTREDSNINWRNIFRFLFMINLIIFLLILIMKCLKRTFGNNSINYVKN